MSKDKTPKADQLREMRERRFGHLKVTAPKVRAPVSKKKTKERKPPPCQ